MEHTEAVKKRRKGTGFGQELIQPGEMSGYIRQSLAAWDMEPIDIADIKQVEKRAGEYLAFCEKSSAIPNKTGLSAWLGINRSTLNSWERGEYRKETHHAFAKKADIIMENVLVDMMLNSKIFPANGIFLLKNHSGYRDQIDIAPAAPQPLGDLPSAEALAAKLEGLAEDVPEAIEDNESNI